MEFLKAMVPAVKRNPEEFMLLHAKKEDGFTTLTPIKGKFLESALEQDFEIR
jgi:hypothetical protein